MYFLLKNSNRSHRCGVAFLREVLGLPLEKGLLLLSLETHAVEGTQAGIRAVAEHRVAEVRVVVVTRAVVVARDRSYVEDDGATSFIK